MDEIVEYSYYDHIEHGRVQVVDVTNGVVSMQKQNETVPVTAGRIPAGVKQSAEGFRDDAEPADVTIRANTALFRLNSSDPE